jgi:hypothetical protein
MIEKSWNQSEPRQPDNALDHALLAIESEPAPDGPSEKLVADTLAALERAAVNHERPIPLFRKVFSVRNLKFSAGVLSTTAAIVLLVLMLTPSSSMCADAIKRLQEAHVVSYSLLCTGTCAGQVKELKYSVCYNADGSSRWERAESVDGKAHNVEIIDIENKPAGKIVCLYPKAKKAMVGTTRPDTAELKAAVEKVSVQSPGTAVPGRAFVWKSDSTSFASPPGAMTLSGWLQFVDRLRKAAEKSVKVLEEKELDGKKVKGFLVLFDSESQKVNEPKQAVVWIDTNTGQPVRIEENSVLGGIAFRNIYFDFQIDPKDVDESIFKADVPEGYTVVGPGDMPKQLQ